jgi:hypothetical protein
VAEDRLGNSEADSAKATAGGSADERRSARSNVLLKAVVEHGVERFPVRVLNLSAHGALVQGDALPDFDQPVTFVGGEVATSAWVAWVNPPLAGISFEKEVERGAVRRKSRSGGHMITRDNRKIDFRRPGFRGRQMTDDECRMVEQWMREQDM